MEGVGGQGREMAQATYADMNEIVIWFYFLNPIPVFISA
jgi:hypothetical protein